MLLEYLYYLSLNRRRRWGEERRRRRQEELFLETFRHAFHHVPFYRRWYGEAGIRPEQVNGLDDLSRLPVVRKRDVRRLEREAPLLSEEARLDRCRRVQTSGSSGIPMTIYFSRREEAIRAAAFHRGMVDLIGRFYFRTLGVGGLRPEQRSRLGALNPRNLVRKRVPVEAAEAAARVYRPDIISGLVSQLHILAESLQRRKVEDIRPRLVATGGEMLLPSTRRLLEDVFQAPVRPYYGAWEFGMIAASCSHRDGYHLCTDDLIVDCLDNNGQTVPTGEDGELVITSLVFRTMPMIRYAIGDIGRVGAATCSCGHPFPRLESLQGRSDDLLVRADGRMVTPFTAAEPLYRLTSLQQFRVIQEAPRRFVVQYVSDQPLDGEESERIRAYFARELLSEQTILLRVPEIPPDPSGKIRKFITRVR